MRHGLDFVDLQNRALIAAFKQCPSAMSHIIIEHFHGAASRVPVAATACRLRVTGFNVVIASQWIDTEETPRHIAWARETQRAAFRELTGQLGEPGVGTRAARLVLATAGAA